MKIVKVTTHNGIFHADEVFALAVLKIYLDQEGLAMEVTRTRDMDVVLHSDIAVDVGGEYSRSKKRFDHHQKQKPANRENGIPYASFGLIWKTFGKKITSDKLVWEAIEKKLVVPIDAMDNGVTLSQPTFKGVHEYSTGQIISAIGLFYDEESGSKGFEKALEIAEIVLQGEIKKAEAKIVGEKLITAEIIKHGEPEVLVLEKYVAWDVAVSKFKNIKLVVFPDKFSTKWFLQAARDNLEVFGVDRISFPQSWRGLSDEALSVASGIADSVFCHAGGFFAVAKSKLVAIEMANQVILDQKNTVTPSRKTD